MAEAAASSGLRNCLCCVSLGRELGEDIASPDLPRALPGSHRPLKLVAPDRRDLQTYLRGWAILATLATSVLIFETLQLTPMINATGDDLHTAVLNHKISRVRKLLDTGLAGEALDVNGPSKASRMTLV